MPDKNKIFNTTKGLITVELYKEGSPEVVDEFIDVSCVDVLLLKVDMSSPFGIHTSLHKDGMPNVLDMSSDVKGSVLLSVGTHHSADERTQDTGNPHSISQKPSTSREPEKDPNNSAQDKSMENELAILHMAKESRIVYLLGHVSILCASYLHVLGKEYNKGDSRYVGRGSKPEARVLLMGTTPEIKDIPVPYLNTISPLRRIGSPSCTKRYLLAGNLEDIFSAATREYALVVEELWNHPAMQATYKRTPMLF
ncbi:extra-large guanine nucleotide-binding protein 1 [Tanacetum coccineum]